MTIRNELMNSLQQFCANNQIVSAYTIQKSKLPRKLKKKYKKERRYALTILQNVAFPTCNFTITISKENE